MKILKTTIFTLIILGLIATIGVGIVYGRNRIYKDTAWYAVYLNNNQVYFGRIASISDSTITLENVHSIETYQEPTQVSTSQHFSLEQEPAHVSYKVVKKASSTGPIGADTTLYINRTAVWYWEKLTSTSKIVELISQEK